MIPEAGLKKNRRTIGLLFGDFYGAYSANLFVNIMKTCREFEQNILSFGGGFLRSQIREVNEENSNFIYDLVDKENIDGIIMIGSIGNFLSKAELKQFLSKFSGLPIVNIGTNYEGMHNVLIDSQKGMIDLMNHMIDYHHYEKIAFMEGTEGNYDANQRLEAYKKVLESHHIPIEENLIVNGNFTYGGGIKAYELLEERKAVYDAVVCANDYMAISVIREMNKRGLAIPGKAAVTGFDDTEECWMAKPSLTTIKQPFYNIGRESVKMILSLINGMDTPENVVIPTEFIIRESCGCKSLDKLRYIKIEVPENAPPKKIDLISQVLLNKINQEMPFLEEKENLRESIARLADCYLKIKEDENKEPLFEEFLSFFNQLLFRDIEVISIFKLISIFYNTIISDFSEEDEYEKIRDLWNETVTLFGLLIQEDLSEKRAKLKLESHVVYDISDTFINTFEIKKLKEVIVKQLPHFQFKSFFANLFTDSSKEKVTSLVAYDQGQPIDFGDHPFPSKQLFPQKLDKTKPFEYVIVALSFKDEHFGFIIYDVQTLTCFIYESLSVQISGAIKGALLTDEIHENTIQLETKVVERTLELENANNKLKQLDTLKNDFIANITHDFRSPLTVILNVADLAMRFSDINEEAKEKFQVVYQSSLRLKNTIDRLLELAKIDARGVKLKIEKVDLISFLNTFLDYYISSIMSSGIKIIKNFHVETVDNFYTDVEKMEEILDNVLSNAIKFIDPNTGVIIFDLEENGNDIVISITDNGIGIPKDKLGVIFNRFEQTQAGQNSQYRGTGIGLAFSKQLAEYLKGDIWAESEGEGKGSKFVLRLKKGTDHFDKKDIGVEEGIMRRRKDTKTLIMADLEEKLRNDNLQSILVNLNKENEFDFRKGVILVIDDDRNIREIIVKYLNSNGFQNFVIAADGKQGLDAVYEYFPDIIVSDYNMPNMKGDDLHNRLVGNPKYREIPFVFLSAVADDVLMLERREIGAVAFLKKPIEEKMLVITVEEQLKKYYEFKRIMLLATVDELTRLNNRRAIIDNLNRELAIRNYRDLSILFFDIDNFKNINDTYGHQAGDLILTTIGKTIREFIRKYDIAGRYGGDEFIVILPDTGLSNALLVAETLGKAIREKNIEYRDKVLSVTSSFGVASLKDHREQIIKELGIESLEEIYDVRNRGSADWVKIEAMKEKVSEILLKMADEALYRAKKTVCKKCCFASEKKSLFIEDQCPKCGSADLELGRNKIVGF